MYLNENIIIKYGGIIKETSNYVEETQTVQVKSKLSQTQEGGRKATKS